mgnify:CR=1 FL=1
MKGFRLFRTIQIKLIVIYVLLILVAMQLIGVYFVRTLESTFDNNFTTSLNNQANLIAEYVKPILISLRNTDAAGRPQDWQESLGDIVNNFNRFSGAEVQIIDENGFVLSSSLNQTVIGQKSTYPEVSRVLQGIVPQPENVVDEFGVRMRSLVIPITNEGNIIGAVYMVASLEDQYGALNSINRIFVAGTLLALALTAILGVILANTITVPIKEITSRATAMAEGNFDQVLAVKGDDEIGQLGTAFNHMTFRLKEALTAIEEEKEKLASILANMSDGVIATDEAGKIIVVNRRATEMLNHGEERAEGREVADLLGMDKETFESHVLGENHTTLIELPGKTADKQIVRITFTPIHRRGSGISGTIIVLHDVTEQEELERLRRDFVANVSHELRTPLTTIKSYLEALDEGALTEPELAKRFVGVTRHETERMIRLVNDLLQLSHLDSRQVEIRKVPSDIMTMFEDISDRFSFQLKQKQLEITIRIDDRIKMVPMDPDKIDQVLDNLLSNAIKFTPEGGHIEVAVRRLNQDFVEVSVQDTGIGIPEKDLPRIFERFYRVDKARSRSLGGTGLGLSIAREIVRAHGGEIHLESKWNEGTRVTFTLPVKWTAEGEEHGG